MASPHPQGSTPLVLFLYSYDSNDPPQITDLATKAKSMTNILLPVDVSIMPVNEVLKTITDGQYTHIIINCHSNGHLVMQWGSTKVCMQFCKENDCPACVPNESHFYYRLYKLAAETRSNLYIMVLACNASQLHQLNPPVHLEKAKVYLSTIKTGFALRTTVVEAVLNELTTTTSRDRVFLHLQRITDSSLEHSQTSQKTDYDNFLKLEARARSGVHVNPSDPFEPAPANVYFYDFYELQKEIIAEIQVAMGYTAVQPTPQSSPPAQVQTQASLQETLQQLIKGQADLQRTLADGFAALQRTISDGFADNQAALQRTISDGFADNQAALQRIFSNELATLQRPLSEILRRLPEDGYVPKRRK